MCVYLRPAAGSAAYYYRIGKGENLSELNERKRFVFRFSYSFRIHTHTTDKKKKRPVAGISRTAFDDIHRRFGPRESSPCRLGTFSFADGEQVSHLSTCQREKLIILYVHVLAPRTCSIAEGGTTLILQGENGRLSPWRTVNSGCLPLGSDCWLLFLDALFCAAEAIRCVDLHCTRSFNPITRQITSINYPL